MQAVNHPRIGALGVESVPGKDACDFARASGVKEQKLTLKVFEHIRVDAKRSHLDFSRGIDLIAVQTAPGGCVLVLLSHRMAGKIDLDMAGFFGERPARL